jgi:hypothetical protein
MGGDKKSTVCSGYNRIASYGQGFEGESLGGLEGWLLGKSLGRNTVGAKLGFLLGKRVGG